MLISKLKMKRFLPYLLSSSLIFSSAIHAKKNPDGSIKINSSSFQNKKYKEFLKYFEPVDTLFFNFQNLIIGDITQFRYLGKSCVIYDRMSDSLFYVDLEKRSYASLTTEKIAPGYKLKPLAMQKYGNCGFIVSSDPYQYIIFEEDKAKKIISNKEFRASSKFIVGDECLYIYQHPDPQNLFFIKMDIHSGKVSQLFQLDEFGKKIRNALFRNPIDGGFLLDNKNSFLIANAFEDKIYKYSLSGKLERVFQSRLKEFRALNQDAANNSMEAVLKMWQKISKRSFDMLVSIYLLNKNTILASYSIDWKPIIELFDKNTGQVINKKKINLPFPIKYCSDDLLFLECFPPEDSENQISNPYVIMFKFKPKGEQMNKILNYAFYIILADMRIGIAFNLISRRRDTKDLKFI